MLKSYGVVAYRILVSAPVPLVLIGFLNWVGLGWTGLGMGVGVLGIRFEGQGLTIESKSAQERAPERSNLNFCWVGVI